MTSKNYGDYIELICSVEEYALLKSVLEAVGVNLNWSSTDWKTTYTCYVINAYKQVIDGWGSDLQKELAKEFFDRYNK